MDDLISRKAVLDKFNRKSDMWNALTDEETSKEFWLFCRVADALDTIPSIPAVPLDKLCEWLQTNAIYSYNSLTERIFAEQWKAILIEWMEEQNA